MMAMLGAREHEVWEDHALLGHPTLPIKGLANCSAGAELFTNGRIPA